MVSSLMMPTTLKGSKMNKIMPFVSVLSHCCQHESENNEKRPLLAIYALGCV